jgi:hypothetical protein
MYYAPSVKTLEKELEALSMGDPIAWRKFKEDRVNCMGDIDLVSYSLITRTMRMFPSSHID